MKATGKKQAEFMYEVQPYGWVKLRDCELMEEVNQRGQPYYHVRGTVVDSLWSGALLAGVPVSAPKNHPGHPNGEVSVVSYVTLSGWEQGHMVRVAM